MFLTRLQTPITPFMDKFPSPSGALMFLTGLKILNVRIARKFPSPSGVLMFLTIERAAAGDMSVLRFSPLPGF